MRELIRLLIERIETQGKHVAHVVWVPAARPFFRNTWAEADKDGVLVGQRPPRASEAQHPTDDPLEWYAA